MSGAIKILGQKSINVISNEAGWDNEILLNDRTRKCFRDGASSFIEPEQSMSFKNEPRLDPEPDILQPGYLVLSLESKLAELFYNQGSAKSCPYLVQA